MGLERFYPSDGCASIVRSAKRAPNRMTLVKLTSVNGQIEIRHASDNRPLSHAQNLERDRRRDDDGDKDKDDDDDEI